MARRPDELEVVEGVEFPVDPHLATIVKGGSALAHSVTWYVDFPDSSLGGLEVLKEVVYSVHEVVGRS